MTRRGVPVLSFALLVVIASARPVAAQIPPPPTPTTQPAPAPTPSATPATDLAIGYSFLHESGVAGAPANVYPWGWVASFSQRLGGGPARVVGEVTANYRDSAGETWTLWGFLGGVRVNLFKAGGFTGFGQALAGTEHFRVPNFSDTYFAFQPGGGVDMPLSGRTKFRAQGDFRFAYAEEATYSEFRFAASVVFGFR